MNAYRPEIDGLRGIAVWLVVLHHAGLACPGGFIGVDVFFTISGFLVGGRLLDSVRGHEFAWGRFIERRSRRILPAALLMMTCTAVACPLFLFQRDLDQHWDALTQTQILLANVHFADTVDYFSGDSVPLLHMWSLAVEEQFYLLLPAVLMCTQRFSKPTQQIGLLVLAMASFWWSALSVSEFTTMSYYGLPSRAWQLLAGTLAATWNSQRDFGRWGVPVRGVALLTILASSIYLSEASSFPGWNAVPVTMATAVLLASAWPKDEWLSRLMTSRWITFQGKISYGLYLWHWPILAITLYRLGEIDTVTGVLGVMAAVGVSVLSWKYFENPIRYQSLLTTPKTFLRCMAVWVLSILAFSGSADSWIPSGVLWPQEVRALENEKSDLNVYGYTGKTWTKDSEPIGIGWSPDTKASPELFVWGDSHGMALGPALGNIRQECGTTMALWNKSGTAPILNVVRTDKKKSDYLDWSQKGLQFIQKYRPKKILLAARWSNYESSKLLTTEEGDQPVDVQHHLQETIDQIAPHTEEVIVLFEAPLQKGNPRVKFWSWYEQMEGPAPTGVPYERQTPFDPSRFSEGVVCVEPHVPVDEANHTMLGDQDGPYYWDDDHLSAHGVQVMFQSLLLERCLQK